MIIWLIFFLFLQTKPSFSPLFAWFQLDFSANSDSVPAVKQNVISKFNIFKLLNLCGNQLISTLYIYIAAIVFVPSVFRENIPTAEYGNDIGRNCLL